MRWRLLPGAAAVMLLVASCRYWDNLTVPPVADRTDLEISIRDAWTGEPLDARCVDQAQGFSEEARGGVIRKQGAPTGEYRLECILPGFHTATASFTVGKGPAVPRAVRMLCEGGDKWYPRDASRQVFVEFLEGNYRVPGRFAITAYPTDTNGLFVYEWRILRHPLLDGLGPSSFWVETPSIAVDTLQDTLVVSVKARLGGRTYDVGSDTMTAELVRNQRPTFSFRGVSTIIKVGCEDPFPRLTFLYTADDDGICDSVVFSSDQPASSLGILRRKEDCMTDWPFSMALSDPFPPSAASDTLERSMANTLSIRVYDDNGQTRDTAIVFQTRPNSPPGIGITKRNNHRMHIRTADIPFRFEASNNDGPVRAIQIDWGDGTGMTKEYFAPFSDRKSFDTTKYYSTPGTYRVIASIVDECRIHKADTLPVEVVANTHPSLDARLGNPHWRGDSLEAVLTVSVHDRDISNGLDSLNTFLVEWGDSSRIVEGTTTGMTIKDRALTHYFKGGPDTIRVFVEVEDGFGGADDTTFQLIKPPKGP